MSNSISKSKIIMKTKNDMAWEKIFKDYPIVESVNKDEFFKITSLQINEYREARLMTKFDFYKQLPSIFRENDLAILPTSRGSYVIGRFKIFESIDINTRLEAIGVAKPEGIETIDIEDISSETTALLCANISGILKDFFDENYIFHTIGGRMGSGDFDFYISDLPIEVSKSQIEIDGGFESDNFVYLVEVKNLIHDEFLTRQIYYPFRVWKQKLEENQINKAVRNIFLTYSDGLFYLREYCFDDIYDPTTIRIIKEAKYSIVKDSLSINDLKNLVLESNIVEDPDIPFPQSNDLYKTINLCELIYYGDKVMSKEDITEEFGFVHRQASYYADSARYLGLLDYVDKKYILTELGEKTFSKPLKQRQFELAKIILSHEPFNIVMANYLDKGVSPSTEEIKELIYHCKLYNVGKERSTFGRRCSTVKSWINWILDRVDV